jgi:inosose dehydratase
MPLKPDLTRRAVTKTLVLGAVAMALPTSLSAARTRHVKIGHTGITWPNDQVEEAIADISSLGFYGFETFGPVLEKWEGQGGLGEVLDKHRLPLISGYCTFNLIDPAKRRDAIDNVLKWSKIIKRYNGRVTVMGRPRQLRLLRPQGGYRHCVESSSQSHQRSRPYGCAASAHRNVRGIPR